MGREALEGARELSGLWGEVHQGPRLADDLPGLPGQAATEVKVIYSPHNNSIYIVE